MSDFFPIRRSWPLFAATCWAALLVGLTSCGSSTATGDARVAAVVLSDTTVVLRTGDQTSLVARPRGANGQDLVGLPIFWAALGVGAYAGAAAAFGDVLRETPNAPEAVYDRGLAELALGRDADAARDLAAYVAAPAVGFALSQQSSVHDSAFVDPFGNRYTSPVTVRRRPYLTAGLGAAAVLTLGAALEAAHFAGNAARGRPVVSIRAATLPGGTRDGAELASVGVRIAF